jgi:hypothetical protein
MAKSFAMLILFLVAAGTYSSDDVTEATVCQILADPVSFNGKMVKVRGRVVTGFEFFDIQGQWCGGQSINGITLAYPEEAGLKPAPPFTLRRDAEFEGFQRTLTEKVRKIGPLSYCYRYEVTATITGRLDGVEKAGIIQDSSGKVIAVQGFGHANRYRARLVIQSVSEVVAKDISPSCGRSVDQDESTACVLSTATNGQMLRVRGQVGHAPHDMLVKIPNCDEAVVLTYAADPDGLYAASATSVNVRRETPIVNQPNLKLRKDREFQRFQKYVGATYKSRGKNICMECYKYEVEATFTGRLDVSKKAGFTFDEQSHKIIGLDGFGHPRPFTRYRLVIESLSDVVARKLPDPRSPAAQK